MEEIYKPDADGPEKVEVYSRENNDMLGDMPEWLIHTGSYIRSEEHTSELQSQR